MSTKTLVTFEDDLTGKPFDPEKGETVEFAFKGVEYEIDLSNFNARNFERSMAKYLEKGRKVRRTRVHSTRSVSTGDAAAVRQWAAEHGFEVGERGRIPAEIRDAYDKANNAG